MNLEEKQAKVPSNTNFIKRLGSPSNFQTMRASRINMASNMIKFEETTQTRLLSPTGIKRGPG